MSGNNPYPAWAWRVRGLGQNEKFVLISIASFSHQDGCSWRSQATIAEEVAASKKSVQRAITSLIEKGYMRRQPRYRRNHSRTSDYHWLPPLDPEGREVMGLWEDRSDLPPAYDADGVPPRPTQATPPGQSVQGGTGQSVQAPRSICPGPDLLTRSASTTRSKPSSASPTPAPGLFPSPKEERIASSAKEEDRARVSKRLAEVWNENRGALAEVKKISTKRARALARFAREAGSEDEAAEILRKATIVVANDDFWLRNKGKYGLDNLLAGDKVFQRAETFDAEFEDSRIIEFEVGDRVEFWDKNGMQDKRFVGIVDKVDELGVELHETDLSRRLHRVAHKRIIRKVDDDDEA